MFIQQFYTKCLSQASYYIESNGEAAIIDPLRDVDDYLALAKERKAVIKFAFETHFHADFVSGHLELARKAGSVIVFGPGAKPSYHAFVGNDNEVFHLGQITIRLIHTPGHTIESCCYLVVDENKKNHCLFSGDTLFVGDVGRPDLLSGNLSKEELGSMLYDSVNLKIKPLGDDIIVYPGHGAGSACGRNLGKETFSTIGEQKKNNYALQTMTRSEFIKAVTTDQPMPPPYFFKDAKINVQGYENTDEVIERNNRAYEAGQFIEQINKGITVLDTRPAEAFSIEHIPGSINIGLDGDFAIWVGTLLELNKPLLIVASEGREKETIVRLARIGYDNVIGYLKDGFKNWPSDQIKLSSILTTIIPDAKKHFKHKFILLDVRNYGEIKGGKVVGSINVPLNQLNDISEHLNKEDNYVIYCAGGYRSMIAASILQSKGFKKIINIKGGFNLIRELNPELIEKVRTL